MKKSYVLLNQNGCVLLKFTAKDYKGTKSVIGFHKTNRATEPSQVANLNVLRKKLGLLRFPIVIFENGVYYFVDGQHLAKGMMENDEDIICFLSTSDLSETMIALNTSAVNWKQPEYINHYAEQNNKNYTQLREVLKTSVNTTKEGKKEGVKLQIVPALLIGIYAGINRQQANKDVVSGEFRFIKRKADGDEIVKQIYDLQRAGMPIGIRPSEALLNLIKHKGKFYNHELFITRFKIANKRKIVYSDNISEIESLLMDIHDDTKDGMPILRKAS